MESGAGRRGLPGEADIEAIAQALLHNWPDFDSRVAAGRDPLAEARGIAAGLVADAGNAMARLENGAAAGSLSDSEVIALESVIDARGRPALRVTGAGIERDKTTPGIGRWEPVLTDHESTIAEVAAATGAVVVRSAGTCLVHASAWKADACYVITNRHVVFPDPPNPPLARRSAGAPTFATFVEGVSVSIDFAFDNGPARDRSFPALDVAYVSEDADPVDVAVIRIGVRPEMPFPRALPLTHEDAIEGSLYVVGHPGRMRNIPGAVLAVFGNPDERKRVSFGEVMRGAAPAADFLHDASTIGGYSGGCVMQARKREVRGLHHTGDPVRGNRAIKASALRAHRVAQWLEPAAR